MNRHTILLLAAVSVISVSGCTYNTDNLNTFPNFPEANITYNPELTETAGLDINATVQLLFENIRFGEMPVRVYINTSSAAGLPGFSQSNADDVLSAMLIWEDVTEGAVSFIMVENPKNAQIVVNWVEKLGEEKNFIFVGEGGPAVIDTGLFNLTVSGRINLIVPKDHRQSIIVAQHEFGHVLGLAHSPDPVSIMYKLFSPDQRISQSIIRTIKELYKAEPLPDLYIKEIALSRKGAYLNLDFTISNRGLVKNQNTTIDLASGDKMIYNQKLGPLEPGSSLFVTVRNIYDKTLNASSEFSLMIDPQNAVRELYESNNQAVLKPAG